LVMQVTHKVSFQHLSLLLFENESIPVENGTIQRLMCMPSGRFESTENTSRRQ